MGANFTPTFDGYTGQQPFRYWCQTVLPLVYDDSLSYYELLNKVVTYLNNVITDVSTVEGNVDALLNAYQQLQNYVNDYFENLNVQDEINNKLDVMATDGTLSQLISPYVSNLIGNVVAEQIDDTVAEQIDNAVAEQIDNAVAEQINTPASLATTKWLQANVNPVGSAVIVDYTLTIEGAAADAKKTGHDIRGLQSAIDDITTISYGKNVFHTNSIVEGKFINYTNGQVNNNADYFYTDYFEVEPRTEYIGSWYNQNGTYNSVMTQFLTFYDAGKTFISGMTASMFPGGVFTTPPTCKYVIYSGKLSTWRSLQLMIEKGNVASSTYQTYRKATIVRHGYTLVDKDGLGNYKTVTEAVKNAQNGDIIVVNPGVYENETVEAWGKEIHIVGVSRELCIIKNALSTYSTPPIEIGGGTLENLTIIAEYGTGKSSDNNGWLPYAVHTEDDNLKNKTLTIRNCTLISELNAAFGLGMRGGCTVNVCDSSLVGRVGVGNRALYFHDADNPNYAGIQTISVCNCEMLSDSSTQATLRIIDQNISGSTVNVRFVNNLLWNKAGASYRLGTSVSGGASGSGWRNMVNVVLDGASYGNSLVALNAQ